VNRVNETASFILFALIATLIVFVLILWNHSIKTSEKIARVFYLLSLFLSFAVLIHIILSASGVRPTNEAYRLWRQALSHAGWLIIGTGISSAALSLLNAFRRFRSRMTTESVRSFIGSPYLLKGLCLSVSLSFFGIEIGKSAHDSEMRLFFLGSGYTVWFMYFIMALETLGGIGLFVSKTIVLSALGLAITMFGAIYTHYHNNDPFADSLDALRLLILLVCVIIVKVLSTGQKMKAL
jgi:uncharacterized membrane protein YphA (DoxX/SURF4 family)